MNRIVVASFTFLCVLSLSLSRGHGMMIVASSNVIYVPGDYPTIQEAINQANSGATISVQNGTYYEHIIIDKSVSLIGEDRNSTIVDGEDTGSVIHIQASNVNIVGFRITRSGMNPDDYGISVDEQSDINISHNTITHNRFGIGLSDSPDNVISGNIISLNDRDGIGLFSSPDNVISGNIISSNGDNGIGLYVSHNNVISGNTISSNDHNGIYLLYSWYNTIYHNNFHNAHQVLNEQATNVWDHEGEGNYWSDYEGRDENKGPNQDESGSDGIGDTPYEKIDRNKDNYPLMGMFSIFTVSSKSETFPVTAISNSTISNFTFEIGVETGNEIIRFKTTGEQGSVGFCRVRIPTGLMRSPFFVVVDGEAASSAFLDAANETFYFTYILDNSTVTIISSKLHHLYSNLLEEHGELQTLLNSLNATYHSLQNDYNILLENYAKLQDGYSELNNSYQEYLSDHSQNVQNTQNLLYILALATAIFLVTIVYLSKRAHTVTTVWSHNGLHMHHTRVLSLGRLLNSIKPLYFPNLELHP